jgi:hypothetical protein
VEPHACTLPTAERPLRVAEFDALFAAGLRSVRRINDRTAELFFDGSPSTAAWVADLTRRESECCSFFTFTMDSGEGGMLTLRVTVPLTQTAVLDGLVDRAVDNSVEGVGDR